MIFRKPMNPIQTKHILCCICLFGWSILQSQNIPYLKDFRYLCDKLEAVHPNIYANLSGLEYEKWKKTCEAEVSLTKNEVDFKLLLAKFLAKIGDSHTRVIISEDKHFPVTIRLFNGKYYVVAAENRDSIGYAIDYINGVSIAQVQLILSEYISAENEDCKMFYLTECLRSPTWLSLINNGRILDTLSITMNNDKTISMKAMEKCTVYLDTAYSEIYRKKQSSFFYRIDTLNNLCILYFNAMEDRACLCRTKKQLYSRKHLKQPLFSEFLIQMFQEMRWHNIQNLVIDLRNNHGGNSMLGDQLLYFIADKKEVENKITMNAKTRISKDYKKQRSYSPHIRYIYKKNKSFDNYTHTNEKWFWELENPKSIWYIKDTTCRFHGQAYVLVSNSTYSAASDLAWYMSCLNIPLIGERTAQAINCFGDYLEFVMPNSKIPFTVSCKYFYDKNANTENRVNPSIPVLYDYEDLRHGYDKPMEKVLEIITP